MDFSTEALTIGRERAFAQGVTGLITWSVADVTTHNPAPGSLDLVLAAFLDLPGPDLQRVIARAAQALAPGGIFLFIGHDPADPRAGTTGPLASMLHESTEVVWARAADLQVATAESRSRPVPGDRRPRAGLRRPGPQPGQGCCGHPVLQRTLARQEHRS
jgi:SAM-dependent methyltransferase